MSRSPGEAAQAAEMTQGWPNPSSSTTTRPVVKSTPRPLALQAVTPEALAARFDGVTLPEARKIVSAVHRHGALPRHAPAGVRRTSLEAVRLHGDVPKLEVRARQASSVDPFVKYAFTCPDGAVIESVRIPLEVAGRFSVCVSSQVGCALACAFCATGRLGLQRNLEAWEIVEQVRAIRAELPEGGRIRGVVFQGMGEPLANVEQVITAIRVLSEPSAQAIDMRAITVCTSGLPTGIRKLASELPAVRLGLSLGSFVPGKRKSLMPIDKAHALDDVIEAVGEHVLKSGQAPMWAYTLLEGVNDAKEDADALARRAIEFANRYGKRPRISLIPYNSIGDEDPFSRSSDAREAAFRDALSAAGVPAIKRYSGGGDVAAACGQLAAVSG